MIHAVTCLTLLFAALGLTVISESLARLRSVAWTALTVQPPQSALVGGRTSLPVNASPFSRSRASNSGASRSA